MIICLSLLSLASRSNAQERLAIPFEGTQAFSKLLHFKGLEALARVEDLRTVKPAETLIVVFGETTTLDAIRQQVGSLTKFQHEGGAILIASDREAQGRLAEFGIAIIGDEVHQQGGAYRNLPHCPLIDPVQGRNRKHPIFANIGDPAVERGAGIATNSPSCLRYRQSPLTVWGEFSANCLLENQFLLPINSAFLMASDPWENDRVLILGSHSVFMNGMLGQPDNNNLQFAANCIDWLRQRPGGGFRRHVFIAENGSIADELDVPLAVPLPVPKNPIEIINHFIKKLQDDDAFYQFIYGNDRWHGLLDREHVLRFAILAVSVLLLLYGSYRLISGLHRLDTTVPLPQAWSDQKLLDPAPIVQRHREVRHLGNYQEAAQQLARQFFAPFVGDGTFGTPLPPELPLRSGWLKLRRLQPKIERLWRLARGEQPYVSGAELRQTVRLMDQVARQIEVS